MCPEEFVTYITALAIAISKDKTTEETGTIALFFSQLGVTLGTLTNRRKACEAASEAANEAANETDKKTEDNVPEDFIPEDIIPEDIVPEDIEIE